MDSMTAILSFGRSTMSISVSTSCVGVARPVARPVARRAGRLADAITSLISQENIQ